ncbi:12329_t:CDS:2 [Entrophospora sp. SA101]|nr:12329_t:CDS:2 [Entrophospora sp. SA101]
MPSPLEIQRNAVKSLWQQNMRNAKEISERLNIPLRSCELKAKLEENDPELEVSERTVHQSEGRSLVLGT